MGRLPRGEAALHPLLAALLVVVLVVKPLVDLGLLPQVTMILAMVTTILVGLFGLAPAEHRWRSVLVAAAVAAIGLQGLSAVEGAGGPERDVAIGAMLSLGLCLALLAAAVLRQSMAPGRVTLRRIEGAVAGYLLIGLIFASLYEVVARLAPDAFAGNVVLRPGQVQGGDFVFFSFVTLTSTGYGDVVPVHPVARSLAMLEAMTGQLYPAIILARLVSLEIAGRR